MSYYDGETLKKQIARGPLPIDEALDIAIQVAQGLAEAHAAGIIHRDIKPANLMMTTRWRGENRGLRDREDLDQTGSTQTGTTLGTVSLHVARKARRQSRSTRGPTSGRSASTLYEMLAGRRPFESDNAIAVMKAIETREPAAARRR